MNKSFLALCLCGLSSLCFAGLGGGGGKSGGSVKRSYLSQGFDRRVAALVALLRVTRHTRARAR